MKKKKAASIAVIVFFAVLTAIGFAANDYGVPVDEHWEMQTLKENLHEYAVHLGADEWSAWFEEQGIDLISESTERDHGQCAYYALAPVLVAYARYPDVLSQTWHAYTWLWFMLGVWSVYAFSRDTGHRRMVSCLGALVLYLCPRFFAEGHYNNKDMVLLSLLLCTLWLGVRFLHKPAYTRGLLLSFVGAMAANTKIIGVMGWGLMGLAAVVMITAGKRWNKRMAGVAAVTIGSFFAFYALLTPACWADPIGYLRYLIQNASGFTRWTGVVVFRDRVIDQQVQKLPWYYLPWMITVTLPLFVLPLAAGGQLFVLRRLLRQKAQLWSDPVSLALIAASLCWMLPLAAAILIRPTMYNGWRHFYFLFAGLALMAAQGVCGCFRFVRRHGGDCSMQYVFLAGLLLYYGWTANGMLQNHPHQYAYYNLLGHKNAETAMELDYWNVSNVSALEALLDCERNEELPLVLGTRDSMSWFGVYHGYNVLSEEKKARLTIEEIPDAPYLLYNTTYARIYGTQPPEGYHELITIDSYGLTVCTIYERE
ncbi:MAG: glycosyltransferase family 39 protein [bacterium]|nr:glycosyltransferase family 39 protein [bacterium]